MFNQINFGEHEIGPYYVDLVYSNAVMSMLDNFYFIQCHTDQGSIGLWQWQVRSDDGSSWVQTW